jgi:glycosyltransferase involved in cell wall biosynthesis
MYGLNENIENLYKMKIAVITPYYKESTEVLRKCHDSVLSQNVSADHFFIADGFPNEEIIKWDIKHISLSQSHDDNGNTPRGIGSILADKAGYDFIAYLDADNWFHPHHLSSLLNLYQETKAEVCASFRTFHIDDGTEIYIEEPDDLSLAHIDTSCFFLHRGAFNAIDIWLKMPKQLSPICDRVFLLGLRHKMFKILSTKQKTLAFRSQYYFHYERAKIPPPLESKKNIDKAPYEWLSTVDGVKETVARLGFIPV